MNNQNESDFIIAEEIKNFEWYYKNKFIWKCIVANLNEKRFTYRGTDNEENPKISIILKIITIQENSNYKALLKEVFLLSCLKKNKYFNEMIGVFLSKDYKKINIIMKKGGESLYDLIRFDKEDYNQKYPNCSQKIIFQIVCGLKVLHDIGFSHNDIKLGNISCTGNRKIKINDLNCADKINLRRGLGTYGYNSPQCLLGFLRTKEDDMYSLGIVFVELLQKKCEGMLTKKQKEYIKEMKEKRMKVDSEKILKDILKSFYRIKIDGSDWDQDINYNDIVNFIKNGDYNKFKAEPDWECEFFKDIKNEEDKDLIKKLLEIDPKKRPKADEVLDMDMFEKLNLSFEESEVNYKEEDYKKYFGGEIIDEDTFRKYLEDIKQKFIGQVIFEKDN